MNIIVLIKQVPDSEQLRYDPATRTLMREGVDLEINPYDKRALTQAMHLRSDLGGRVTAVTMGPPQAREALVECLGRGLDGAVHICDRALAGSDTEATSRVLANALSRLQFDLVLCGKYSIDAETGQVGPEVARLLDVPQVAGVTAIEVISDRLLRVRRETDWGFEEIECSLPALLTCSERLIKPVKTTPAVIEEGHRRITDDPSLIETLTLIDLGIDPTKVGLAGSPTWVEELRPMLVDRERLLLSGEPGEIARRFLEFLRARGLYRSGSGAAVQVPALPAVNPRNDGTGMDIWAVAEWLPELEGPPTLRPVSLELMSKAAVLAAQTNGQAVAFLAGHDVGRFVPQLGQYGAGRVLLADDEGLEHYRTESYAWLLAASIEKYRPWAVLLPSTSFGRDLAPRVAAQLGLGLTGDCLGVEIDAEGHLRQFKPAFGGQVVAPIASRTLPNMATIRPGVLPRYAPRDFSAPDIVRLDLEGLPQPRARVVSCTFEGEAGLSLDEARLVVCAGTGIGGPEALPYIERLAQALGAWMGLAPEQIGMGGTRKIVDNGWLPRQQQIGVTGHTVAPALYLALGVQGKFNHMLGVLGSGTIAAVNLDPGAPIFEMSDLGMLADWRSFTDALIARLEAGDQGLSTNVGHRRPGIV